MKIYFGSANENGEFLLFTREIVDEDDKTYYTNARQYPKSRLDSILDYYAEEDEDDINGEYYEYYSLDKNKVIEFLNEKKKYFINKVKKALEKFENSKIEDIEDNL